MWTLTSFQLTYFYAEIFGEDNTNQYLFSLMSSVIGLVSVTMFLSRKILLRHLLILNILISGIFASIAVYLDHVSKPCSVETFYNETITILR